MSQSSTISRTLTLTFLGLVLLLAALWGSRPLIHDDLFFHLATGQYVVENHQVPTTDVFSFTRGGERWVSHEWGFGVLAYFFWSAGGDGFLVALKALVTITILVALLALMVWRSGGRAAAPLPALVALLAVGLWAINDQLILRASLFSSLFVLVLLALLHWFDAKGGRLPFMAIALLFLFWGNFHGEVIFGWFVLGLFTIEAVLARWNGVGRIVPTSLLQANRDRPFLPLLVTSLVLTLVNPNGIQVLLYPFRLAGFLFSNGEALELGHFAGATPAAAGGFYLLIAILLLGLLPVERLKILSLTEVGTVGAFLLLSLKSHRFIIFFTLFSLPVIVRLFADKHTESPSLLRSPRVRLSVVTLTMVIVAATAAVAWRTHERGPVSPHFPAGAIAVLETGVKPGRAFNHQNYGGYLRWNLGEPVFWDGRNLLFASLMKEVAIMPLAEVVEKWDINYLLLTEFEYQQMRDQIMLDDWGLAFWDDFSALFLLRNGSLAPLLAETELQLFPPFGGIENLSALAKNPPQNSAARHELDHILSFQPQCQRALYLHGLISFYEGDNVRAASELRHALELGENPFVEKALARVQEQSSSN